MAEPFEIGALCDAVRSLNGFVAFDSYSVHVASLPLIVIQGVVLHNDLPYPIDDFANLHYIVFVTHRVREGKPAPFGKGTGAYESGLTFPIISSAVRALPDGKPWKAKTLRKKQYARLVENEVRICKDLFEKCEGLTAKLHAGGRDEEFKNCFDHNTVYLKPGDPGFNRATAELCPRASGR